MKDEEQKMLVLGGDGGWPTANMRAYAFMFYAHPIRARMPEEGDAECHIALLVSFTEARWLVSARSFVMYATEEPC